jgi:exoribonuclease-2
VARSDVYRALVQSRAKLAYDTVGSWLEGATEPPAEIASDPVLEEQVRLQDEAAQRLRTLRRRHGLLDLETIEPRAVVAGGKVIDLAVPAQDRARDIIESFMIAANVAMARFLKGRRVASIRRVVRTPKRWDRIVQLASDLGETLPAEPDPKALAAFLARRKAADPEHHPDLSLAVVKLLGSGEYVLERRHERNTAHFGLAVAEYAHSTAPNRRYADLVTQRLLKATLDGNGSGYTDETLMAIAARCTEREDAARKVERTVRKSVAAALVSDRIGDRFTAIVTGASDKGTYVRVLRPPLEGRVVRAFQGLDVGDTVRVTLIGADPGKGFIDFEGPSADIGRKIARSRQKKQAAARLSRRVGRHFAAIVTAASPDKGTWVRLLQEPGEGRVVRGHKALQEGQTVRVKLVSVDPVHGFIDFEYGPGIEPRKAERTARKKAMAWLLRRRVGQTFEGVVTAATPHATYVRTESPETEGRIVRGWRGLQPGQEVKVVLLAADPKRGFIDFAVEPAG